MAILRKLQAVAIPAILIGATAAAWCGEVQQPGGSEPVGTAETSLEIWVAPETGMEFVLLEAGSFTMGSPPSEAMREAQEVAHRVQLTRPFWIGRYEVTQDEWRQVMGTSPSRFENCGGNCPVESISGYEVLDFVDRLTRLEGRTFRLPTEAEWEYACRAGTTGPFPTGDGITTGQANFDGRFPYPWTTRGEGEFRRQPSPVGSFAPNPWGLYDMQGNVWEWTADRYCPYPAGPITDPRGGCDTDILVIRGGSWIFGADSVRCALRYTHHPRDRGPSLGFRVVTDRLPDSPR